MTQIHEAGVEVLLSGSPPDVNEAGVEVLLSGSAPEVLEAGFEIMLSDAPPRPFWHPTYVWDESFGWVPTFPPELFDSEPPYP